MPEDNVQVVQPTPSGVQTVIHKLTPPRRSALAGAFGWLLRVLFLFSLFFNGLVLWWLYAAGDENSELTERFHSGSRSAKSKIAVVRVEGLIVEVLSGFASQQLKEAAQDEDVKAIVLLVNSPGGSVTASDQLHKQVKDLHDGKWDHQAFAKPVVVSMASVAASGGYYIAASADKIVAQPTTITGSIGVYASFLDLHRFGEKYGIDMDIVKRGELKGGSMFSAMTPEQRQEWEDLLEHSYQRFMTVVKEGRGTRLRHGLRDELRIAGKDGNSHVRRLADGGVFTADQALQFGLIDQVGYLDDAIQAAKGLAGLAEAEVVTYTRPLSLTNLLFGPSARHSPTINLDDIPGATARPWFLAPGYELTAVRLPASMLR